MLDAMSDFCEEVGSVERD